MIIPCPCGEGRHSVNTLAELNELIDKHEEFLNKIRRLRKLHAELQGLVDQIPADAVTTEPPKT